jgi:hypothetical protein
MPTEVQDGLENTKELDNGEIDVFYALYHNMKTTDDRKVFLTNESEVQNHTM